MLDMQSYNAEMFREPDFGHPTYSRRGWIGVDLDGTLARSGSRPDLRTIGPPIKHMLQRVLHWVSTGREVKIFTARASDESQCQMIHQWCEYYGLPKLEVTDRKDFRMVALWDDRAVGVVTNLGIPILARKLTVWQRLRLRMALFFLGSAAIAINHEQLRGHLDAALEASSTFWEF